MRIRQRKSRTRLDNLMLDLRTAGWLGRRLWRPTAMSLADRALRPLRSARR